MGGPAGKQRLRELFEADYAPVSSVRANGLPVPHTFEELIPAVAECCRRITHNGKPVRIVNGKNREDAPNFERDRVWNIIVGGAKLSRGYTLEGFTISYYRRRAAAADTLMQMGRWFGSRRNYRDLVCLYIGDQEPAGKDGGVINLYKAFRSICRDEEEFRQQLERYASLSTSDPAERVTPRRVPPLVPQHMLMPTARNKMYNAKIEFDNLGGQLKEPTVCCGS